MASPRGVDARLSRMRALRKEPAAPGHLEELRKALADRSNMVAAEAAEIAGTRRLAELKPDLVAAFDRLMIEPETSDKLCLAKLAILEALNQLGHEGESVFLRGIQHVQLEPRWGGAEDVAAPLRAAAAFGLVRINYRPVLLLLAELLADPHPTARVAAARALGAARGPAAIPLLRFKACTGDKDPAVVCACLSALMSAAPQESLSFVARFLNGSTAAIQEGAAFALGESRLPEALQILNEHLPQARQAPLQDAILLSISTTRLSAALEFLLETVTTNQRSAPSALSALAIHRHDDCLKARVAAAVETACDAGLQAQFQKEFESGLLAARS